MKPIQAYKCDYCPRCFARPVDARNHEVACKNNPARHMCVTCVHCKIKEDRSIKYPVWSIFEEPEYGESPTCTISNKPIHEKPYLDECETNNCSDYGGQDYAVPGTCWNYEYKGYAKFEWETEAPK